MNEWQQLTKDKCFISDIGESQSVQINGKTESLGRFAVWSPVLEAQGHQVIEVGNCVDELMKKYKIPQELVMTLEKQGLANG